jgi:mono/diheme cytochrome c family protein
MRAFRLILPAAILAAGMMMTSMVSFAKPEYAKKEKKNCATCHVKAGSKDLNDIGKCYAKNSHSLDKCEKK